MNARPGSLQVQRLRAFTAALLFGALALASALSAAPLCHEWVHDAADSTSHQCAATLVSSGSLEHVAGGLTSAEPDTAPPVRLSSPEAYPRLVARLEFTRLEHAPPLFS